MTQLHLNRTPLLCQEQTEQRPTRSRRKLSRREGRVAWTRLAKSAWMHNICKGGDQNFRQTGGSREREKAKE